jgi:hypothetical protein
MVQPAPWPRCHDPFGFVRSQDNPEGLSLMLFTFFALRLLRCADSMYHRWRRSYMRYAGHTVSRRASAAPGRSLDRSRVMAISVRTASQHLSEVKGV